MVDLAEQMNPSTYITLCIALPPTKIQGEFQQMKITNSSVTTYTHENHVRHMSVVMAMANGNCQR